MPSPELLAWALVQAGQLDFSTVAGTRPSGSYLAAIEAKPGDWPALDHLAELRAAQKRYDESISIYRELVACVPRPELFQALGDVYRAMGRADDARGWHARALAAYRKAADAGSSHYFHHLAGYYCDAEPNPAEAVRWARADMEVRRGVYAYDALAWALYHAGDYPAAAGAMDEALAPGTADAHVLYHASLIYARRRPGEGPPPAPPSSGRQPEVHRVPRPPLTPRRAVARRRLRAPRDDGRRRPPRVVHRRIARRNHMDPHPAA